MPVESCLSSTRRSMFRRSVCREVPCDSASRRRWRVSVRGARHTSRRTVDTRLYTESGRHAQGHGHAQLEVAEGKVMQVFTRPDAVILPAPIEDVPVLLLRT